MKKYLWDFSFEELFFQENGQQVLKETTRIEKQIIERLQGFYEAISRESREKVNRINGTTFSDDFPELIYADMMLQLCLIYSLSASETLFRGDELIQTIQKEALEYFYEYRIFRETYSFETYSIVNDIAISPVQLS